MANVHKTIEKACEGCGGRFKARADNVKAGKGRYCSRSCSGKSGQVTRPVFNG